MGGAGGGMTGTSGIANDSFNTHYGTGGTQTLGGYCYNAENTYIYTKGVFGKGGDGMYDNHSNLLASGGYNGRRFFL